MSAVAGVWNFGRRSSASEPLKRMLNAQQIYGPHDAREWRGEDIAVGRRLFRTLPEDAHDRQPLQSADGRFVLVADVRLDNRPELCTDVGVGSSSAAGLCDSAILLECLVKWGEGALDRIVGDFAFALWDSRDRKLLLARDFIGQRPLHYHRGDGFFAFASMPKGLHAHPDIPYAPDERAIAEFVALLPADGTRSFFEGIATVPAAHLVSVTSEGLVSRRYWNPSPPAEPWRRGGDHVEGVRHHLEVATRARLRGAAGGAVGSHLSAGYDSSAVTATAARQLALDSRWVVAFTAVPREGYDGPVPPNRLGDEGPLAAETAAMYPNIEHVLIRSGHRSPLDEIDRCFHLFDRPTLNLCNMVWTIAINAAARDRGLNVLLTGQTGNMSLSYSGAEFLPDLAGSGRFIRLAAEAIKLVANGSSSWRAVAAASLGPFLPAPLWRWINRLHGRNLDPGHYTAIRSERLAQLGLPGLAAERQLDLSYRPRRGAFDTRLWVMGRVDSANHNKGILAGWGLDQRDPTADRRLVEYCLALPMAAFVSGGEYRALARAVLADRVPRSVLDERRSGYQAADWHEGMTAARADLAQELSRLSPCAAAARTLDIARLQRLTDEWPAQGWEHYDVMAAYRLAMYRGVSAGHFLRKASGSNA